MILRKPYAFFIKYFKIINLIMAFLMAALLYQSVVIGKFLNKYIVNNAIGTNFVISEYISFYSFLFCLAIIILIIIVTMVMFVKKKPMKLYIFNFVVAIFVFAVYIIDYKVMSEIGTTVLDIRASKAIRDITFIAVGVQAVSFIITLVRATGFDLKSFEFSKDLKELEIDVKDDEEFEVAVEIDKNKARRKLKNKIRHYKYYYLEHKFVINAGAIILFVIILFFLLINNAMYKTYYKEGRVFNASSYQFDVKNSYLIKTDADGQNLSLGNEILVAVKLGVSKKTDLDTTLNTGLITLKVGSKSYSVTTKYNPFISDIGEPYEDELLSTSLTDYILTFKIPERHSKKNIYLKINDNVSYVKGEVGAKNIFVKLKPIDLSENTVVDSYKLKDELTFQDNILENSVFVINEYEINNKFKLSYNFCSKKGKCVTSYEYLTPTATGNYFKTLLRLKGEFELDEDININDVSNIFDFLNRYATIYYEIDGQTFSHKISSQKISPNSASSNDYYIEVNRDIVKAQKIYFVFKIRNYIYKYIIK